jgi:Uma2 family endonuclease
MLHRISTDPKFSYISPEDYLEGERMSPIKHEYRRGYVHPMVGANKPHVILVGNLSSCLGNHLADRPCVVMTSDMKVRLEEADCYYYPDVLVTCDPKDLVGTEDYIYSPKLLIEVLSKSTSKFDRGEKFTDYQTCKSLEEYVLVSQTEQAIEVRSLIGGEWQIVSYGVGDRVVFHSVEWSGDMKAIYDKVTLVKGPTDEVV